MQYSQKTVDKIFNCTTVGNRNKIHRLLEIDAIQYTKLGTDSTESEINEVKFNSHYIYKTIEKIDSRLGKSFLGYE